MLHLATGFAIYAADRVVFRSPPSAHRISSEPAWLAVALFFSLFPDLDAVAGILGGDMGRYHNQALHSLLVALPLAMVLAWLWATTGTHPPARGLRLAPAGVLVHLALDSVTAGRGVMLLWPFTDRRFLADPPILRGLVWSEGLVSREHILTFLQELPWTLGLLALGAAFLWKTRREPAL
jgi:membrane-bound metal-dependent hydrolase YbcI (DUF457 family)